MARSSAQRRAIIGPQSNGKVQGWADEKQTSTVSASSLADKKTDYLRWRLLDERGRQTWHYLDIDEQVKDWPQSTADKYHLGLPTVGAVPEPYRNFVLKLNVRNYQIYQPLRHP